MASPAAVLAIQVDANTLQANAALAKTQAQLKRTEATAVASSAVMKKALLGVGAIAVTAGAALFKIGEEFDNASDTIRTKTGATGKELDKLNQSFKNVVTSVPVDFGTAADAVAGLNQRLHLTGKPLDRLAKQITALTKITGTDIQENIESITRLFGDWSIKTGQQSKTLDELFRLTQVTGIQFSDLSRLMVQFGSPLRQLGFRFDEAAAMFARFEREGVNMQTLLPGLRMALKNIAVPTDDLAKLFKQLGINTKDPHTALLEIFDLLSKDKVSETDQTLLASSVFGGRAWADMKAAIEEGRFEFGDLIKTMKGGSETIRGTEKSTRDFSEQWILFRNRVMVWLEPLATTVFKGVGDAMKNINQLMKGRGGFADAIKSVGDSLRDFWNQSKIFRAAMGFMADVARRAWAGIKQVFQAGLQVTRGIVKVISGVLTLNFGRAWSGVKDIFGGGVKASLGILRAMTAPVREIGARIGGLLKGAFSDAAHAIARIFTWLSNKVLGIFSDLKGAISDALSWIQGAVNDALVALGIKDKINITTPAGPLGPTGGHHGFTSGGPPGPGGPKGHQLGGVIAGFGTGDKIPAMLEPGEFVVNRKATAKHAALLNAINFKDAPRFATGGLAGMQPAAASLARKFVSNFGGSISSGLRPGDDGFHGRGMAFDWVPGNADAATRYANQIGAQILEGIHNPAAWGRQVSWDSGHQVSPSFWGGATWADHVDHLHVAVANTIKGIASQIGRIKVSGHGPLAAIARASIERIRKAANTYLGKQMPTSSFDVSAGGQFSKGQLASLWSATGSNGDPNLMAAIGMAESGGNPQAVSSAGARGLWQVMPFWGGGDRLFDPKYNATKAHMILAQQGLGAWSAYTNGAYQQYLQRGGFVMPPFGGSFADGGVVPGPTGAPRTIVAHGGESVGERPIVIVKLEGNSEYLRELINVEIEEGKRHERTIARMR